MKPVVRRATPGATLATNVIRDAWRPSDRFETRAGTWPARRAALTRVTTDPANASRIGGFHSKEKRFHHPRRRENCRQTDTERHCRQYKDLARNHPDHSPALRSERHADSGRRARIDQADRVLLCRAGRRCSKISGERLASGRSGASLPPPAAVRFIAFCFEPSDQMDVETRYASVGRKLMLSQ
jgi:hypothetical protein